MVFLPFFIYYHRIESSNAFAVRGAAPLLLLERGGSAETVRPWCPCDRPSGGISMEVRPVTQSRIRALLMMNRTD